MVTGWRIYAVVDGALAPPWATKIWSDRLDPGEPVTDPARCLFLPHRAPARACTCGHRATEDLRELLRYGTATHPLWPRGMLAACGVLARVRLHPPFRAGYDMPRDDPWTTRRGAGVELLELHLGRERNGLAEAFRTVYGCPVTQHEGERWWDDV